jgi:hyaluronoglucosaminidase
LGGDEGTAGLETAAHHAAAPRGDIAVHARPPPFPKDDGFVTQFPYRGVIEGYYGPPYTHADRLWWIDKLARWQMNLYVHAPKSDALHRQAWRTPYPVEQLREFSALLERGAAQGVEVGFALSPGLSITYSSVSDLRSLETKLLKFRELGARFFALCLDDVPTHLPEEADRRAFPSLAHAHVSLAHAVQAALGPGCRLLFVPTDYLGVAPTEYLETLGGTLSPTIEVAWTGRTVVSPEIRSGEAAQRAATLRRRLVVWDNVPVADGPMRSMLHLGPFARRDPTLPEHVCGFLLNVMQHAHASAVTVHTASAYLRNPGNYDPERAWSEALQELGAGAEAAFTDFAAAHRFSPLHPRDRDPTLEACFSELRGRILGGNDPGPTFGALRGLLERRLAVAEQLRTGLVDRKLASEIEPWIESHQLETKRMLAALEFLDGLLREGPRLAKVLSLFGFEGRVQSPHSPSAASYGPRRVVYPQLVSMRDDGAGFGADPALFKDCNLADEVVAFAESFGLEKLQARGAGSGAPER